jgi:hypothetical protein
MAKRSGLCISATIVFLTALTHPTSSVAQTTNTPSVENLQKQLDSLRQQMEDIQNQIKMLSRDRAPHLDQRLPRRPHQWRPNQQRHPLPPKN